MKATKDANTRKWKIQYYYKDWQGNVKNSTKGGLRTKKDAEDWARSYLSQHQADFTMNFADFIEVYYDDIEPRIKEHTMRTKKYIIDLKVLPYFKNLHVSDIKAATIRKWQNELMREGYSETYLKTINNQLSAILNHAVSESNIVNHLYKVKMMMLLWYTDAIYYKRYGKSMTGLVYVHMTYGALPIGFNEILSVPTIQVVEEMMYEDIGN